MICIFRLIALICFAGLVQVRAESSRDVVSHPAWVLSDGFHTGVAVRMTDAGPLLRTAAKDPQGKWVMVGWGDRDFFMAERPSLWITIKAVFWPTESALHVIPLRTPPEAVYRKSDIVRLSFSPNQFSELRNHIEAQFATDKHGNPVLLGRGFSERSHFFLGTEKFYFPVMCNWWVAKGLRKAGIPLSLARSITANALMRQVEKHGVKAGAERVPVDGF